MDTVHVPWESAQVEQDHMSELCPGRAGRPFFPILPRAYHYGIFRHA